MSFFSQKLTVAKTPPLSSVLWDNGRNELRSLSHIRFYITRVTLSPSPPPTQLISALTDFLSDQYFIWPVTSSSFWFWISKYNLYQVVICNNSDSFAHTTLPWSVQGEIEGGRSWNKCKIEVSDLSWSEQNTENAQCTSNNR